MVNFHLLKLLKAKRKPVKRLPVWLYPFAQERKYTKILLSAVKEWKAIAKDLVLSRLPSITSQAYINRPTTDSFSDEIEDVMKIYTDRVGVISKDLYDRIVEIGRETNEFNASQWYKITNHVFGIPLFQNEPWLQETLKSYVSENVSLITKLSNDLISDMNATMNRGIKQGLRHETIMRQILGSKLDKGVFNRIETRARLIARDQVAKWNGQLMELKQTEAGITEYFWSTSLDERVRESHRILEGKLCRWDNPSVYKNSTKDKEWLKKSGIGAVELHVGQDYQCRCTASPNFDSIPGINFEDDEPEVSPVPEKEYRSPYHPDNLPKELENALPEEFYDMIGSKVNITQKGSGAYYMPFLNTVNIPNSNVKNYIHEMAHAYYEKNYSSIRKLRDPNLSLQKEEVSLALAREKVLKGFLEKVDKEYINYINKNYNQNEFDLMFNPNSRSAIDFYGTFSKSQKEDFGAFSDIISAQYDGGLGGYGHNKDYWKIPGNKENEVNSHIVEYFYSGNEFFDKYIPETAKEMRKYWENEINNFRKAKK
jgi:SPP1 gp7 family putative phage head morphogenesis protein